MREKELSCNPYSIDTKNVTQTLICSSVESSYIQKYIKEIIKSCNTTHAGDIIQKNCGLEPIWYFSFLHNKPLNKCRQFTSNISESNTTECYKLDRRNLIQIY